MRHGFERRAPGRWARVRGASGFAGFVLAALAGLLPLSCGQSVAPEGPTGEIQLALSLPDGTVVNSVDWKVLSSSNAVIISGTLNTAGSRSPSFIASLPGATGDTVNMTARTAAGVSCAGTSAPFNVVAGQSAPVPVSVNILCDATAAPDAGVGSVVVTGTVVSGDHCPTLAGWLISPQAAAAPDPIDLTVTGNDGDVGETLTYAWTATAGTFSSATSPQTEYTCTATGSQTLSVAVTDNHTPVPCTTHFSFPTVTCL